MFPKTTLYGLLLLFSMALWMPTLPAQSDQKLDTTYAKKLLIDVKEMFAKGQGEGLEEKLKIAAEVFERALGQENTYYADVLHQFGRLGFFHGDIDKGIEYTEKALAIRLKVLGFYDLDVATSYNNLGNAYGGKGNLEKAIECRKNVYEIRLKILKKDHPDVIAAFKNLGFAYGVFHYKKSEEAYVANDLETAIQQLQHADSVFMTLENYWWILLIRTRKAEYYGTFGKPQQAIQACEAALPMLELTGQTDSLAEAILLHAYATNLLEMNRIDQSERAYLRALAIKKNIYGENAVETGIQISNLANLYFRKGQFKKAIEMGQQGITLREGGLSPNPSLISAYVNLGFIYDQAGFHRNAQEYFNKAEQILNDNPEQHQNQAGIIYQNMANMHHNNGDFDKSIAYNQLAKLNFTKAFGPNYFQIAAIHFNLGLLAIDRGDWPTVIDQARQALKILQLDQQNTSPIRLIDCYEQLSDGFLKINIDSSLHYAKLALQLCESLIPDDDYANANSQAHLGTVYAQLNRFKEADALLLAGERKVREVFGNKHVMTGLFLENRADILAKSGEYATALTIYDESLHAYGYTEGARWDTLINTNPMLSALQKRNRVLLRWYQQEKNEATLATIQHRFDEIQDLLNFLRRHYQGQETKLTFAVQFKEAAEDAIVFYQSLSTPQAMEQAWAFAEKSRSLAVLEAIQNTKAWQFKNIPDSVRITEESFAAANKKWIQTFETAKTLAEKDSCYRLLLETRVRHESWLKELEQRDSAFFNLKYSQSIVDIRSVANSLDEQQTLLEYFVADSSIYIFLVQPQHFEIVEVKKEAHFEQWITDLTRNGIYGFYSKKGVSKGKSINNFGTAAYQLYEALIAPVKAKLTEKLIIIPDGILGYVPFEALLTQKPPRPDAISAYKYLIQDHQISYCYSATLLKEMRNKKHRQEPTQKLLAMAPFFLGKADTLLSKVDSAELLADVALRTRDTLTALPSSGPEVASINKILTGQALYGKEATLQKFQELASNSRILHLSTHGKADDRLGDYAYLAFGMPNAQGTFDKLYARDLYNLSLNADLVVLSACETGIGKLQRGEGIVSLARAFAYAGAKSIVTTLWKVSDEQSKNLMTSFYKYLSKGKEKDEALRLAKLEFLQKNEKKTELLHPFFWASFIGIGDMRGLENSK